MVVYISRLDVISRCHCRSLHFYVMSWVGVIVTVYIARLDVMCRNIVAVYLSRLDVMGRCHCDSLHF